MPEAATIIGIIAGGAGLVGSGGALGWWLKWRQEQRAQRQEQREQREEHREEHQVFFASYERSIATLQSLYDREKHDARKEEKRQRLETLEDEYLEQQKAYRQNWALRERAPRGVLTPERPPLSDPAAAELTELVHEAGHLSPALLTEEDYFLRGNALYALKRYDEALADFDRALRLRPNHADTLYNRGTTLESLKRYDEALADYNDCLELRPDHADALYNRACLFSRMQRWDESLRDLRAAVSGVALYKGLAREDEDFEALRNHPQWGPKFWDIVGREDE